MLPIPKKQRNKQNIHNDHNLLVTEVLIIYSNYVETSTRLMDERERARTSHQEWRQSLSPNQHEAYLARRRVHARGKRPAVEMDIELDQHEGPSNRDEPATGTFKFLIITSSQAFFVIFFSILKKITTCIARM